MQNNKTSWTAYNTQRPQTGAVNEPVQELRLVDPQDTIDALDKRAALIEETISDLFEGND